jgi:iron complex transport system substrate-binding protein
MISALNEISTVYGFSGTRFIYNEDLRRNVKESRILEIGYDENLDKEQILKIEADLVIAYGIGGESAGYIAKLKELGIKVLFNADYLETDPLGKAEWIKMIGALYGKETMADSIFRNIEFEYNRLKDYLQVNAGRRPKVMLGLPFKDTWYISPGNSYISQLISDAGGEYLWHDTESSVSMPTGLENVYVKALSAEFWLNTGIAGTREEIKSADPRLAELPCFRSGNLFNNNKRSNVFGGNDYWEGGAINPQIILKDIATILHPELFKDSDLFYYKKLN